MPHASKGVFVGEMIEGCFGDLDADCQKEILWDLLALHAAGKTVRGAGRSDVLEESTRLALAHSFVRVMSSTNTTTNS